MIRKKQNIVPVRQGKDFRSSGRNIVVIRMSRNTEAQISAESTTVNITGKLQGRTGMSRQNPPSWTVVKRLTGSWRSFRMDMALSDVRIICRVRTTFMFLIPRSAALNLKTGDYIQGNILYQESQGEKFSALLYVSSINGFHPSEGQRRYNFEDMTPIFPNERLVMERAGGTTAMRIVV